MRPMHTRFVGLIATLGRRIHIEDFAQALAQRPRGQVQPTVELRRCNETSGERVWR